MPAIVDSNSITLFAKGGSVYVDVMQKNDGIRIYRGAIQVDSPLTLVKSGPVKLHLLGENTWRSIWR